MSLTHNERVKLTASYLNTAAGASLTAGVIAPIAAAIFGFAGSLVGLQPLTLVLGITIFLVASVVLHLAARHTLGALRP